jgi:hypothetical protein
MQPDGILAEAESRLLIPALNQVSLFSKNNNMLGMS